MVRSFVIKRAHKILSSSTMFGVYLAKMDVFGCASAHCQCRANPLYFRALNTPFLLWV